MVFNENLYFKCDKKSILNLIISFNLVSLPLPFVFSNISLGLLILYCILNFKELKFNKNIVYILPIVFFLWGTISIFWSIDSEVSIKALSKNISLLIVPTIFLFLPIFSKNDLHKILRIYAYSMSLFMILMLTFALSKYIKTGQTNWFFYHDLVTLKVNAIYVSAFVAMAFLHLLITKNKRKIDWLALFLLLISLILLSSKNILFITIILSVVFILKSIKKQPKKTIITSTATIVIIFLLFGKFAYNRYSDEFRNFKENVFLEDGTESISIYNSWNQNYFDEKTYFNGTSLRIYQARLLKEFLEEYPIFWKGFGLNAVQDKIKDKQIEQDLDPYYWDLNFHNQYVQTMAELGFIGLILLLFLVLYSFINAYKQKDFYLFTFALLTFSFFLSESALSRQRGIMFFIFFFCLLNQQQRKISNRNQTI